MPPQSIFFPFVLPGLNDALNQANKRYQGKTNGYAVLKTKLEGDLQNYIKSQRLQPMKAVCVKFLWKEPSKKRDPDNIISAKKFILDALVKSHVLPGDGWRVIKGLDDDWALDKHNPGVLVTLTPSYPDCLE